MVDPAPEPSGSVLTAVEPVVTVPVGADGVDGVVVGVGDVVDGVVVDDVVVDGVVVVVGDVAVAAAVVGATGAAAAITGPVPQAWSSERPTFCVEALTDVSVTRRVVVLRAGKMTVVAPPALSRAGTVTVEPSEKVSVAPVTWSAVFGRS